MTTSEDDKELSTSQTGGLEVRDVRDVDESVLKDLESKYIDVACPVHGTPPTFEVGPDGSVVEAFCCEALLAIVRELQVQAGERPPVETEADADADADAEVDTNRVTASDEPDAGA
jgi:hypothetical protein